ncbi:type II toxin-antitoxin system HicB family antitoxin [Paraburkholderia guartelaensis]|uniref:Type II toxin-antitoxin system HicB family antitoxin n=1 Tax=Paraburkholderia guartelaensis TaxID=2546446 RepID=A0A4R5L251_9BURK|nr:type II toxin-antitoxin system HicB family antitoxin [Paraburkholderia guartelaensis]TDG02612.1 type II toxin-antitoxin system HicB family antitoxin [Paraburkholderia guartelaensis]
MLINGHDAVVEFDPVTGIYHGEFTGLGNRVYFYGADEEQMVAEGRRALAMFLHQGECRGIDTKDSE